MYKPANFAIGKNAIVEQNNKNRDKFGHKSYLFSFDQCYDPDTPETHKHEQICNKSCVDLNGWMTAVDDLRVSCFMSRFAAAAAQAPPANPSAVPSLSSESAAAAAAGDVTVMVIVTATVTVNVTRAV
jgi:hypothetical protein